jgi:phosphohistidine swiveling domain-containing protein
MAPTHKQSWIIPLTAPFTDPQGLLGMAGGKGTNLIRLESAGLPVPTGFVLSTSAYRFFIEENSLELIILGALPGATEVDLTILEKVSEKIQKLFSVDLLPSETANLITDAYAALGRPPVAVRSSATVEDLPGLSFAGQQDTYLNIVDEDSLIQSVVKCWASLWTARAIGYRNRNGIPHVGIGLAVVVQQMIQSESSGVLFTANPLTGLRSEVVIDATFGLGEALVSGQVEPDHYVVDSQSNSIVSKSLGAKALSIESAGEGGTVRVEKLHSAEQAIPDELILELSALGKKVESLDGIPQDIEWALAAGYLHLLQSRPITSIFPLPRNSDPSKLDIYFSFAAVQGMLDPMTPIGKQAMEIIFSVMSSAVLHKKITEKDQTILFTAAERFWVRFTPILRNTIGRKAADVALKFIEPTIHQTLATLLDDPRFQPERRGIRPKTLFTLARTFLPLVGNIFLNIASPEKRRLMIVQKGEDLLVELRKTIDGIQGDRFQRLEQASRLLSVFCERHLPKTFFLFVSGVASGMASYNFLYWAAGDIPEHFGQNGEISKSDLLMEVTRGIPNNPTTSMDLALWDTARVIRAETDSLRMFETLSPEELTEIYRQQKLPPKSTKSIDAFLTRYGLRGLGEIDLGRSRWINNPLHVFESLKGYIQITDPSRAPDVVFAGGEKHAQEAIGILAREARVHKHGWVKSRMVRVTADRARRLMGLRESPKFFAVRFMGLTRQAILSIAEEFARSGELEKAEDFIFLSFDELARFASHEGGDWKTLVLSRREIYDYEKKRRQIPRLILSDGRAFFEGIQSEDSSATRLPGSPVSPGVVEGRVRVVLDPRKTHLLPGEILVCPGTDPSWTPLFLTAGGLIMEVGGMMTHGAVVAREYGIPAVVGVHEATTRLQTGQRIRLDGSSGVIEILAE